MPSTARRLFVAGRSPAIVLALATLGLGAGRGQAGGSGAADEAPAHLAPAPVDYAREIRPILSEHCFACHGPDRAERQAGLRLDTRDGALSPLDSGSVPIVPGDAGASELWRRITNPDEEHRMPPPEAGERLSAAQIDRIRRWIDEGAEWRAHWSFVPPVRPAPPAVSDERWPRNAIDRFVLARLDQLDLRPSPAASKETLIRRATFDLTGLPPTLPEIDAFLADDRPDAYARVVDRLLASERYGEHMARHWLDVARYGDTHGFHLDNVRSLWPWRDWVIRAFNANMPFDRFTVEQLAGDLLPEPTPDQRIATGFNRCNPTTGEGGLIAEEYLVKYAVDRVQTTSTAWLGLTMGCAQCHDHKFDPLTRKDFYRFFAFFHNVAEEASDQNALTPPPIVKVPTPAETAAMAALEQRITALDARLTAPMPEADRAQAAWAHAAADRLRRRFEVLEPLQLRSERGATLDLLDDLSVLAGGENPATDVYEVRARTSASRIRALRLDALAHDSLPNHGVGRAPNSNFVLTGLEVEAAPADAPAGAPADAPADASNDAPDRRAWQRVELALAAADYSQNGFDVGRAIDAGAETGWAVDAKLDDRLALFVAREPFGFAGGTELRIRLRFESVHAQHAIGRFRLSLSTDPALAPADLGPWFACGPFPAESGPAAFDTVFPPEQRIDFTTAPRAGAPAWIEHPEWRDGQPVTLPGESCATYLYRTIVAPEARPMTLSLGSDDALAVWLNGESVLSRKVVRALAPDQERVAVELRPGVNRLLLKVVNYAGDYGFSFRVAAEAPGGLALPIARILATPSLNRSPADLGRLRDDFRSRHVPAWTEITGEMAELRAKLGRIDESLATTMVMAERRELRPTYMLNRGQYDQKGEQVEPGVPVSLPPLPATVPADRLALARWLVDPEHPLTARVAVNRLWQQVFGTGIVATPEDFGARGAQPTHPELLDWLATEFVASGWDVEHVLRLIVTSATYRQSSCVTPEGLDKDRHNRFLSRGPRFRLDAEQIRDAALQVSGLLVGTIGGPSVKPYQPPGLWKAVGYTSSNTANFVQDQGDKLYRRSMYTFWKRTSPPPTMQAFDAPSREYCIVHRTRTNTPLQALVLLNDPQFVEAARGLAQRALIEAGPDPQDRAAFAFRLATARRPDPEETEVLLGVLDEQLSLYRADRAAALRLLAVGESPRDPSLDPAELAAWTAVTNLILNLDETVTKG